MWEAKFANTVSGEQVETTLYIIFRYLFYTETPFAFVTILCVTMGCMLTVFTIYHVNLACNDVTTNERYKSAAFNNYYTDKVEFLNKWKTSLSTPENPMEITDEDIKNFQIDTQWTKN